MEKNLEKAGPGKFVAFTYKLTDADNGTLIFETPVNAPDNLVYGVTADVVPALQNAMHGLKEGDKFSITLPPEVAFGEKLDDNIISLPIATFERDGKVGDEVKVCAELPMMTEDGFTVRGRIIDMNQETVTMDFNHPFAGLTVKFDGEVVEVRDATPEELQPRQGCGCHGCGHDHDHEGCCGGHDHNHEECCGGHDHNHQVDCCKGKGHEPAGCGCH